MQTNFDSSFTSDFTPHHWLDASGRSAKECKPDYESKTKRGRQQLWEFFSQNSPSV